MDRDQDVSFIHLRTNTSLSDECLWLWKNNNNNIWKKGEKSYFIS